MSRNRFKPEVIVNKLREADVLISQGRTVAHASKQIGVTEQTYYRWRKEYGGLKTDQAKRLKERERENARLKRLLPIRMGEISVGAERHPTGFAFE